MGCPDRTDDPRDKPIVRGGVKESQLQTTITLHTADGWTLMGDLYSPQDKPIGAVVLLHQRGGSGGDWRLLCDKLSRNGIVSLAIDQRGAGRSAGGDRSVSGENAPWNTSKDIDASVSYLLDKYGDHKPGHNSLNIGLVGASYGANNALMYAAAHSDSTKNGAIKTVSLFSPGANYNNVLDALSAAKSWTGPMAIFYATADSIAGLGPIQIRDACPSHDKLMNQVDDEKHGTDLLNDDTIESNVVFLTRTLR